MASVLEVVATAVPKDLHGFLNPNDSVAISFWIISIAMVAATVFFLMEAITPRFFKGYESLCDISDLLNASILLCRRVSPERRAACLEDQPRRLIFKGRSTPVGA